MTDEERQNRNPAPEISRMNLDELGPEIYVQDLELHKVYVMHQEGSPRYFTMNYMGPTVSLHPTLPAIVPTHRFHGPRVGVDVFLQAQPNGTLQDAQGHTIHLWKYEGPDR